TSLDKRSRPIAACTVDEDQHNSAAICRKVKGPRRRLAMSFRSSTRSWGLSVTCSFVAMACSLFVNMEHASTSRSMLRGTAMEVRCMIWDETSGSLVVFSVREYRTERLNCLRSSGNRQSCVVTAHLVRLY